MQAFTRLRIVCAAGLASLVLGGAPAPAAALGIAPDPVLFDLLIVGTEHLKGNIDFVGMVTGTPAGGIVLDGSVGAGDVTLIFTAAIDADSDLGMFSTYIARFPSTASSPVFSAVGTIPGAGVDISLDSFQSSSTNIFYDEPDELGPGRSATPSS